ncbi:hypothetical protein [Qipengyuania sp. ASV99]|uniref:hypothetical protein n=1 Tax=Qipengyuania sp. ASV99 TaxID=3399681 RepID=UPI003A4C6440
MTDLSELQPLGGRISPSTLGFYLVMLALAAILGFYVWNEAGRLKTPPRFETAQIVSFYGNGKGAVVLTKDGGEQLVRGRASDFAGCKVQGQIRLERRDDEYRVAIDGCSVDRLTND